MTTTSTRMPTCDTLLRRFDAYRASGHHAGWFLAERDRHAAALVPVLAATGPLVWGNRLWYAEDDQLEAVPVTRAPRHEAGPLVQFAAAERAHGAIYGGPLQVGATLEMQATQLAARPWLQREAARIVARRGAVVVPRLTALDPPRSEAGFAFLAGDDAVRVLAYRAAATVVVPTRQ